MHKQDTTAKRWRTQCHVNPSWLDPRRFSALKVFAVPNDGRRAFAHALPPLPWTPLAFVALECLVAGVLQLERG